MARAGVSELSPPRLAGGAVTAGKTMSLMPVMRLAAVSVWRIRFTSASCSFKACITQIEVAGGRPLTNLARNTGTQR